MIEDKNHIILCVSKNGLGQDGITKNAGKERVKEDNSCDHNNNNYIYSWSLQVK